MSKSVEDDYINNRVKRKREKSTKLQVIFMLVWLLVFVFFALEVVKLVEYTLGIRQKDDMWLYNGVNHFVQSVYPRIISLETEDTTVSVATLGNIYLTPNMIKGAKQNSGYDFSKGLEEVKSKLNDFDFVVANLSTTIAGKSEGYSTAKLYNAPDEIITTLKDLNISAVATATYHAFDKEEDGMEATIEKLEKASIKQTGISTSKRSKPIILTKDNISIGVLSYTNKSNIKLSMDAENLNVFSIESVEEDIKYLKDNNVDIILAYLDTYGETTTMVDSEHKKNIDILIDGGVNIVIGGGVAAVQDDYEDLIELEDNTKSHIYSMYSLGDFMGGYTSEYAQATIIPSFEVTKSISKNQKGEVKQVLVDFKINAPILAWTSVDKNYNKTMYLMEDEVSNFNTGKSNLSASEYKSMKEEYIRISDMYK